MPIAAVDECLWRPKTRQDQILHMSIPRLRLRWKLLYVFHVIQSTEACRLCDHTPAGSEHTATTLGYRRHRQSPYRQRRFPKNTTTQPAAKSRMFGTEMHRPVRRVGLLSEKMPGNVGYPLQPWMTRQPPCRHLTTSATAASAQSTCRSQRLYAKRRGRGRR